jgi:hypothetical protein
LFQAKDTQKLVEQKPKAAFPIVMALMGTNGNQQFDRLTKTNTISSILAAMNEEGIQKYRDYLLQQFAEKEDEERCATGLVTCPDEKFIVYCFSAETLNRRRAWAIEQLSMLIRNGSIPKTEEMVQSILEFLTLHGLFTVRKKTDKGPIKTVRRTLWIHLISGTNFAGRDHQRNRPFLTNYMINVWLVCSHVLPTLLLRHHGLLLQVRNTSSHRGDWLNQNIS